MAFAIGFTGSREGMSERQKAQFETHLTCYLLGLAARGEWDVTFHHGHDWNGADGEAEAIALRHLPASAIVRHPPESRTSAGFLHRNREIADAVDVLFAAPVVDTEVLRSGTWSTVRYARQRGVPYIMLPR